MIQNLKVDIVYYMTATDFEFEFNLGSCCHMRMLNDKVKDKNSYVNSLARAVSRSQIIISCGPLFGEDGLISVCAAAINHGLKPADNKTYGIASEDEINIIEGSIPLVTPEGYFGGCIIESGNQSIILLTENRTIRKSIMKTLIHPYIEDMSIIQSKEKPGFVSPITEIPPVLDTPAVEQPEPEVEQPAEPEAEEATEAEELAETGEAAETEEVAETEETDGNHNIAFDFSQDESGETEETLTAEEEPEIKPEEAEPYTDTINDIFIPEEKGKKAVKPAKTHKGLNITILILVLFLALVVLALCYFAVFMPMQKGISTVDYFKQLFNLTSSTVSV